MTQETDLLARLTQRLVGTRPGAPLADRLLVALADILHLEGGALTIGYTGPDRTVLCATDPLAERIEELQDVLREGPGLDAFRTGQVIVVDNPDHEDRWPMLLQHLHEAVRPVPRLLAVPMTSAQDVMGVALLHAAAGAPVEVDEADARFLVNAVGVAVLGGFERLESSDLAWSARDLVNQATGMVVAQLALSPSDALALLRAHAYAHDTTVAEVARSVVDRSTDFRNADERGPS
jgi:GAF domain-containing protein